MKRENARRAGWTAIKSLALKRVYVVVIVMVAVFLLFLGTLAGCGSKPKSVTGRSSAPADAQTAPPGAVKPQLLLFTSPG